MIHPTMLLNGLMTGEHIEEKKIRENIIQNDLIGGKTKTHELV